MTPRDLGRPKLVSGQTHPPSAPGFWKIFAWKIGKLGRHFAEFLGEPKIEPLDAPLIDFHEVLPPLPADGMSS